MDEKLKAKTFKKEHFSLLQNAPFRSQIFKIFFALGGKRALTPLTKILRTFLSGSFLQATYWGFASGPQSLGTSVSQTPYKPASEVPDSPLNMSVCVV